MISSLIHHPYTHRYIMELSYALIIFTNRYPSTTTRVPRSVMKCSKLKANECRILLLIVYPVFKNYISDVYYTHLRMLAFGIHIGESSHVTSKDIESMKVLLLNFVDEFPYYERYIK